jgi:hypothetical protein
VRPKLRREEADLGIDKTSPSWCGEGKVVDIGNKVLRGGLELSTKLL